MHKVDPGEIWFRTASLHAIDLKTDVSINDRSTIGVEW